MPPKPKYLKEEIVEAGFRLVREKGAEALTAREMAETLGTSSRPIFTAFRNMEEFKAAVVERAEVLYDAYCENEIKKGIYPEYKAMGMAYICLSIEEKNIFKLLFMRDRTSESESNDHSFGKATSVVESQTGLSNDTAGKLHFEMWAFVHGIATMAATSYLDLNLDMVSDMLTDVYEGLKRRHMNGKDN